MREKRSRSQEKAEPLFDYDLDDFDPDEVLAVDLEAVAPATRAALESAAHRDDESFRRQQELASAGRAGPAPPRTISSQDPLRPELFVGHHRRMEREERRMQVQERQGLMTTALRLRTQRDQLTGPEWLDYIDRIVRINDPDNRAELKSKRDLAVRDMSTFLEKFEEYHRRINRRESRAASKCKPPPPKPSRPKHKPKPPAKRPENLPTYEPPRYDELTLFLRPTAFGHMVPPRVFPPQEFAPPPLLVREVESYDLIDDLKAKRKKL